MIARVFAVGDVGGTELVRFFEEGDNGRREDVLASFVGCGLDDKVLVMVDRAAEGGEPVELRHAVFMVEYLEHAREASSDAVQPLAIGEAVVVFAAVAQDSKIQSRLDRTEDGVLFALGSAVHRLLPTRHGVVDGVGAVGRLWEVRAHSGQAVAEFPQCGWLLKKFEGVLRMEQRPGLRDVPRVSSLVAISVRKRLGEEHLELVLGGDAPLEKPRPRGDLLDGVRDFRAEAGVVRLERVDFATLGLEVGRDAPKCGEDFAGVKEKIPLKHYPLPGIINAKTGAVIDQNAFNKFDQTTLAAWLAEC